MLQRVLILGAGQMGTAFAQYLAKRGLSVTLWMRRPSLCEALRETGVNSDYLPDIHLDSRISYSCDLSVDLFDVDIVLLAIPSSAISEFLSELKSILHDPEPILFLSTIKGLPKADRVTRVSESIREVFENCVVATLSGPNIALEVAKGLPTTTTIACEDVEKLKLLANTFESDSLRVFPTTDIIGTELCGSLKNVVTIGVGLVDGLGLGENIKGVVVATGFYEIRQIIEMSGGLEETSFSPAGLEDLLVASYSGKSRNYRLGFMIGKGKSPQEIENEFGHLTFEGIKTAKLTWNLAQSLNVSAPLVKCIYDLVSGQASARDGFEQFWSAHRFRSA